jgi:hypothetical protein
LFIDRPCSSFAYGAGNLSDGLPGRSNISPEVTRINKICTRCACEATARRGGRARTLVVRAILHVKICCHGLHFILSVAHADQITKRDAIKTAASEAMSGEARCGECTGTTRTCGRTRTRWHTQCALGGFCNTKYLYEHAGSAAGGASTAGHVRRSVKRGERPGVRPWVGSRRNVVLATREDQATKDARCKRNGATGLQAVHNHLEARHAWS